MKHNEEARAEALAIALMEGAYQAAEQTGIPRRTISSWLTGERPAGELPGLIANSRDLLTSSFQQAISEATQSVIAGLRDPRVSLKKKAQVLVILERHQHIARDMELAWKDVQTLLD